MPANPRAIGVIDSQDQEQVISTIDALLDRTGNNDDPATTDPSDPDATVISLLKGILAQGGGDAQSWDGTNTALAGVATVTIAAVGGKSHVVKSISASFDQIPNGARPLLQLLDGVGVRQSWYLDGTEIFEKEFAGIVITAGNSVSLVLASGGAGVHGTVNMDGVTR